MASFFLNREGNISAFKIGIAAAVAGGALLVAGYVIASIEQNAYKSPLDIQEPPNTVIIIEEPISTVSKRVYLESSDSPEAVARFYDVQLAEFQKIDVADANRDRCIRTPRDGAFPSFIEGNGSVPYEFRCLFQESSVQGIDRSTMVLIQPGVLNEATGDDYRNKTRIEYEQYWQP